MRMRTLTLVIFSGLALCGCAVVSTGMHVANGAISTTGKAVKTTGKAAKAVKRTVIPKKETDS